MEMGTVAGNLLVEDSFSFAVRIIELGADLEQNRKVRVIVPQLVKSGTSIGANIREANYAASRADFINKFQIALKECYETDYWLALFHAVGVMQEEVYQELNTRCSKIRRMLISSINTAKEEKLK